MAAESFDVVVVGAGISGVGAAWHLRRRHPQRSFVILEGRDALGGTWDLFRYPGIRSDSDMYTLGYGFRPWTGGRTIADGASIARYVRETAAATGADQHVRLGHRVVGGAWSSADAAWTVTAESPAGTQLFRCRFLWMCSGYYAYEAGYTPELPGLESFGGPVVHPQHWPEALDVAGRRVVVLGSGSTAVGLVPALAARGARVTMLQRSPTYVVAVPSRDAVARVLDAALPARLAFRLVRARNALLQVAVYQLARRAPRVATRLLLGGVRAQLGPGFDVATHFTPRYPPWDERLCVDADGELFAALRSGAAEVVTDHVEHVAPDGVRLRSGRHLAADVLVTATGLDLRLLGGVPLTVDGTAVDPGACLTYKGAMLSDVPNLASTLGYTNASWTLKADLVAAWVCRLLRHMDRRGARRCVPRRRPDDVAVEPLLNLAAGYVRRRADRLPKQGARRPWRTHQNYLKDLVELGLKPIEDGVLEFS